MVKKFTILTRYISEITDVDKKLYVVFEHYEIQKRCISNLTINNHKHA